MTNESLREIINNNLTAKNLADNGNDAGCALAIQADLPFEIFTGHFTGELGILALFDDAASGETCLQKIESIAEINPIVKRVLKWIAPNAPGVDFGDSRIREMVEYFYVAELITEFERNTLLRAGEKQVSISANDISTAWSIYRQ